MIFLTDILLNLNTAYFDDNNVLIQKRILIAKHYFKHGLILDGIASFPYTLTEFGSNNYSNVLRIFRLRALTRLLRLSRLFKLFTQNQTSILKYLQIYLSISHNISRLLKFIAMIVITIHIAACL